LGVLSLYYSMVSRKIKNVLHFGYKNKREFEEYNPNVGLVDDWRNGEEDQWVKADDGQIFQVLRRGELRHPSTRKLMNHYIRTILGSFVCSKGAVMDGELRENIYSFGIVSRLKPHEHYMTKKQLTSREFLFAKYIVKGDGIAEAYMKAFPTNKEGHAEHRGKKLIKTDRIQKVIREEVDKVLNEADITPLYLLEKMRAIVDKDESQDKDKISAIKTLMQISGMMDTEKRSESITLFQGFTKEQLDAISEGGQRKLIEASQEVEK